MHLVRWSFVTQATEHCLSFFQLLWCIFLSCLTTLVFLSLSPSPSLSLSPSLTLAIILIFFEPKLVCQHYFAALRWTDLIAAGKKCNARMLAIMTTTLMTLMTSTTMMTLTGGRFLMELLSLQFLSLKPLMSTVKALFGDSKSNWVVGAQGWITISFSQTKQHCLIRSRAYSNFQKLATFRRLKIREALFWVRAFNPELWHILNTSFYVPTQTLGLIWSGRISKLINDY